MAPGGQVCHMEDVREGRGHLHVLKHLGSQLQTGYKYAPAPGIGLLQAGYKNQVHIFKIYDHKDYKVKSSTTQLENTFKVIKRLTSLLLVVANTSSLRPFGGLFFNKTSSAWLN